MKTRPVLYVQRPYLHPQVCCMCGKGDREWYVDFGLDIGVVFNAGYEGVIYLCNVCLPGFINDLIAIDAEHQGTVPAESTFDELSRFGRGPELPEIPTDAPSSVVFDGISGTGFIQAVDSETDVRDDSVSDGPSEDSGLDDSADESDSDSEQPDPISGLVFDLGRTSS